MWRLCCRRQRPKEERSPIQAIRKRWELLSGGCLVVNFRDDPGWDHSRLFLWPINANTWIVLTPDGDKYAENFGGYSRMRVPPIGESETPEIGSVEFSRGWTLNELSELVREGRNLALSARTSMELTYDRDPTTLCDSSSRLFNVPHVTLSERVKRGIVRKLPKWPPTLDNPPTLSRDLTTHVGTSFERRAPRQRTPRVRTYRAISVSHHPWVSMETCRADRLKFGSVVVLPDDALVRGARGLMLLPGGGYVAVQRIPSSNLATFVDRVVDGMLPPPGAGIFVTRPCLASRDEGGDKAKLRVRFSIRPPTDEEHHGTWEPSDDLDPLDRI